MRFITPVILAVVLSALLLSPAAAADIEPAPTTYVEDRAGILDAGTKQRLIGLLRELEQKTAARIIVLIVQTTGGQDIHSYAFERADVWKFGPKRNSASVLFVIANADRKYSFQVGYDWEAVLPDGYVGQVGREYLVPPFQAGRPSQGVYETAAALAQKIATDRGVTLTGMPTLRPMGRQPGSICALSGFLPVVVFILIAGLSRGRRRGMFFWGMLAGAMMGGRRGGGFGGGGFGGGGFGGFGGGGGGGFGGGGASGGW